jgi:DHA2 family multidrug resistance protein
VGGFVTDSLSWHWIFLVNLPFGLLSLFLVRMFVVEPPIMVHERKERLKRGEPLDYVGLVLVALGLGSLTYVLAEGQVNGWFTDTVILASSVVAIASLAALIWWELRHPYPVVRLRLLANRQFAIVIALIFLIGMILFGSTQIIPQMIQEIFGYTAYRAGLALSIGGLGTICMMPIAGRLAGNLDPRLLIVPAFLVIALGLYHFTTLTTQATFRDLALARLYQTFTLPFVFVTINTIAYVGLRPNQTTDASALLNVFRNIGGSVGISLAQTILATGAQFDQSRLTERANLLNPNVRDYLTRAHLEGVPQIEALAGLYRELARQAEFLAYFDVYQLVAALIVVVMPLCLLLRGDKTAKPAVAPV